MKEKEQIENPWLKIPYDDYERHMELPDVAQLEVLSNIFNEVVELYNPKSLALIGCATGNGFEKLEGKNFDNVVGVDINPDYINICRSRYENKIGSLGLLCGDLLMVNLQQSSFDLIHAALLFEYVDVEKAISKIAGWLKPGGVLSVVLQLSSNSSAPVSETPFESIKILIPYIKLVDENWFIEICENYQLKLEKKYEVELQKGKRFLVVHFLR